jgi:hypothetical protein
MKNALCLTFGGLDSIMHLAAWRGVFVKKIYG